MTDDEAKTCLLLGMKIRRASWLGYLSMINGELYKCHEEEKRSYQASPFSAWCTEPALHQFGPWEIVK